MRVCVLASSPITQGLRWFMLPWSDFTFTMCKVMEPSFICLPLSFSLSVKKKLTCRALPLKAKPSTKCWFSLPPGGFWVSQKEHFADLPSHSYEITRKEQLKQKEMHHNQCTHVLVKSRHLHFSQCYLTAGLLLASSRDVDVYRGLAALLVPSFSLIRSRCYQYIKLPLSVVISPSSTY